MISIPWVEWVGYSASIVIAISLLMTSLVKLRIINSVGCLLFTIYGFVVGAYPIAIANGVIILINIYQLYVLYQDKNNGQDKA